MSNTSSSCWADINHYYNEIDAFAAQWLRNLIAANQIGNPAEVDERSIADISAKDLRTFTQCHFFAGIGVWSYALRAAKWPDGKQVWTGSCPCQPFSVAGKRKGQSDARHLWPEWLRLIRECRPAIIFGEQVASNDGLVWLDLVQNDLEDAGYAVGAINTCASGFGAPHIRQRLFFVAEYSGVRTRDSNFVADTTGARRRTRSTQRTQPKKEIKPLPATGIHLGSFWRDAEWVACRDGKVRAIEPGTFPLVDGASQRLGRLRAYGNSIVASQAQAFITAYMTLI